MTTKIDLRDVFREHLNTLRDAGTGKLDKLDLLVFFGIPAAVAVFTYVADVDLDTSAVGILVGALSILAGLLINVLVLLYTVKEVGPTATEETEQKALIKEVNANLLYSITIAVLAIVALCILPLFKGMPAAVLSNAVVFVLGNFVLTLLMALKRLKVLLDLRFKV